MDKKIFISFLVAITLIGCDKKEDANISIEDAKKNSIESNLKALNNIRLELEGMQKKYETSKSDEDRKNLKIEGKELYEKGDEINKIIKSQIEAKIKELYPASKIDANNIDTLFSKFSELKQKSSYGRFKDCDSPRSIISEIMSDNLALKPDFKAIEFIKEKTKGCKNEVEYEEVEKSLIKQIAKQLNKAQAEVNASINALKSAKLSDIFAEISKIRKENKNRFSLFSSNNKCPSAKNLFDNLNYSSNENKSPKDIINSEISECVSDEKIANIKKILFDKLKSEIQTAKKECANIKMAFSMKYIDPTLLDSDLVFKDKNATSHISEVIKRDICLTSLYENLINPVYSLLTDGASEMGYSKREKFKKDVCNTISKFQNSGDYDGFMKYLADKGINKQTIDGAKSDKFEVDCKIVKSRQSWTLPNSLKYIHSSSDDKLVEEIIRLY